MESGSFYQNVFLLTHAVQPTKDFLKHFKEAMFDKPNTIGFVHVTHYLLTIYNYDRFKKQIQWPVLCKKTEAKYRTDVKDFLTTVANENPDLDFPQILASHLLHAGGSKFTNIMWKLSTVTLRTFIKRETETMLLVPKAGVTEELSRIMLNNRTDQDFENIEEINRNMVKIETESKEYANETADWIRKNQEELFLTRQNLIELSSTAPVHPAVQKRLANLNDIEGVASMWKNSMDEMFEHLKKKQIHLREIAELSNNVACMVGNIVSTDTNILDGKHLPNIDTNALSEVNELSPEAQIMLYRLYESGTLILENFLSLFTLVLMDLRRHIEKYGFPDFSACESQILASCEDMKSMSDSFHTLHDRIIDLTSRIKNRDNREDRFSNSCGQNMNNDLFDSVLLKSSPTININLNPESDGNEFHGRLELTPVENVHRALFSRHKRNDEITMQSSKLRPKLLVSRIDFDDTRSSSMGERFSPVNRNTSSRMLDQWNASRNGKYSRVFSTHSKRTATRLNYGVPSVSKSSRINSITDMNLTSNVYDASELRSHLATKNNFPKNREMYSPKKFTPTKNNDNRASSTINECEKSVQSIELTEPVRAAKIEVVLAMGQSPKTRQFKQHHQEQHKTKPQNKRLSISDLVDRYKKVCDKSVDVTVRMNFSSESSDGSEKY